MSFAPQGTVIRSYNGRFISIPMNPIRINMDSIKMVVKPSDDNQNTKTSFERRNELCEINGIKTP